MLVFLTFGTINTVAKKIMYQTSGLNMFGGWEAYSKPWWTTLFMFFGEAMCLLIYYIIYWSQKGVVKQDDKYLKEDPTGGMGFKRFIPLVFILAACDLTATSLIGVGLLYCSASITQILRSFLIVFVMGIPASSLRGSRRPSRCSGSLPLY